MPRLPRRVRALAPVLGPVLLGVVAGLVWWLVAPIGPVVQLQGGSVLGAADPELTASQDGWLVVISAAAGLVCGAVAAVRPGAAPVRRSLAVVAGCLFGAVIASLVGQWLGPPSVAAQVAAGADPERGLVSPLRAHSTGVLLVWPAVAALVMTMGHLAAAWSGARTPRDPAEVAEAHDHEEPRP
ncbi:hypothetical protein SAMN06264364_11137 [Quadrisphaera granulorum]|uniref:DUF2567 domain-containing protein n=1 Tax=Quadrisphaera granulorum TaxID=317664 RepID=A0A316A9T8_9ACTN|nr:hypothetical protein [Quadrisphaera granulorum]PWJ53634.1 hypothetical protein BXY45_11137 [Quadrisphaera granulorum]SZE96678.1 hypothetical protein SAMN06264364_11137 [Quadrisphaera granulorum]